MARGKQPRRPTTLKYIRVGQFKEQLNKALDAIPGKLYEQCRISSKDQRVKKKDPKKCYTFEKTTPSLLNEYLKDTSIMNRPNKNLLITLVPGLTIRDAEVRLLPTKLPQVAGISPEPNGRSICINLDPKRLAKFNLTPDQVWHQIEESFIFAWRYDTETVVTLPAGRDDDLEFVKKFTVRGMHRLKKMKSIGKGRLELTGCLLEDTFPFNELIDHDKTETMSFRDLVLAFAIPQLRDRIRENCGWVRLKDCYPLIYYLGDRLREIATTLGHE